MGSTRSAPAPMTADVAPWAEASRRVADPLGTYPAVAFELLVLVVFAAVMAVAAVWAVYNALTVPGYYDCCLYYSGGLV